MGGTDTGWGAQIGDGGAQIGDGGHRQGMGGQGEEQSTQHLGRGWFCSVTKALCSCRLL